MQDILARLEKQLGKQFPDILENLNPPATLAQIEAFETVIKQKLPDDVKTLYLWRNGCVSSGINLGSVGEESKRFLLFSRGRWCGLSEVFEQWRLQNSIAEGDDYFFTAEENPEHWESAVIRPWTFPPAYWLPLCRVKWDWWVYVDMLPGKKGLVGQLVELWSHGGVYEEVVATGTKAYLLSLTEALERSELRYDTQNHLWFNTAADDEFRCIKLSK